MSIPKEVLDRIATPGDVAAFFLGYGAGFVIDAFALLGGIPTVDPLTAGVGVGATALGAKQALHSTLSGAFQRRKLRRRVASLNELLATHPQRDQYLPSLEKVKYLMGVDHEVASRVLLDLEKAVLDGFANSGA